MANSKVKSTVTRRLRELASLVKQPPPGVSSYWNRPPAVAREEIRALSEQLEALSYTVTSGDLSSIVSHLDACLAKNCGIPRGLHGTVSLCVRVLFRIVNSLEEGALNPSTPCPKTEVVQFKKPVLDHSFLFIDAATPIRNLAYLDTRPNALHKLDITLDQTPLALLLVVLGAITPLRPIQDCIAIVGEKFPKDEAHVAALARLYKVSKGEPFHITQKYLRRQNPSAAENLDVKSDYSQFDDVAHVISEANEKEDVLDRFLRLYQVLENFMVRRVVVKVTNTAFGRVFSIRDFRRLYKETIDREQETLTALFNDAFNVAVPTSAPGGPHPSLLDYVKHLWQTGLPPLNEHNLTEAILDRIVSGEKFSPLATFHERMNKQNIVKIIYGFRNSIVHNKETEFHLTHKTLSPGLVALLNDFFLPVIEEVIFICLCSQSNLVRYKDKSIALYPEI